MFNFNLNFKKRDTIYISHIEQEKIVADSLKHDLQALGYDVISTPYEKSQKQLKTLCPKIIETVNAVVVLKSPSASRSERVWADMAHARLHGLPVIPMVVHEFDDKVPVHHHISAVDNFEEGVRKLHHALERRQQFAHNQVDYIYRPVNSVRRAMIAVAITVLTAIAAFLP